MVQRLDLGGKSRLGKVATATDLVQGTPARREIRLDVLAHVGNDDAQHPARLQATPALGEKARPFHAGFQMLEIVFDMDAACRTIGQRQMAPTVDARRDAGRRKQIKVDPAVHAKRTAADVDQHFLPRPKRPLPGDPGRMAAPEQPNDGCIEFDPEGAEHPRIDRHPRDQPGAELLLQRGHARPHWAKARPTKSSSTCFSTSQL